MIRGIRRATHPRPLDTVARLRPLTVTEMRILRMAATGLSNDRIALLRRCRPKTILRHMTNIFTKLGVSNRTQAVLYALRAGWFDLREVTPWFTE